jgi:lactoylglutathione lyase
MKYLHTMVRVSDVSASLRFFCDGLGLKELRRTDHEAGNYGGASSITSTTAMQH